MEIIDIPGLANEPELREHLFTYLNNLNIAINPVIEPVTLAKITVRVEDQNQKALSKLICKCIINFYGV